MTDVVVIGAGITGLVAARRLARTGVGVTVIEPDRPGGKLQTTAFAGGTLDEAADAFLARVPEGTALATELGLDGDLVAPAVRNAFVWSRGALRRLPTGQVLGVPTDLDELDAAEILSPAGLSHVRRELTLPLVAPSADVAIGPLLRERLGDEVVDRLVDPLVGGINAGAVDRLSLAATVPQLDAAVRSGEGSLIEACRAQRSRVADPAAPVFFAPRGGMGMLARASWDDAAAHGAEVRAAAATQVVAEGSGWRVELDSGAVRAPAVVVAAPATAASTMLRAVAPRAATLLASVSYASVAMVALAVSRSDVDHDLDGSGFLVPRAEGRTITACSWASSKWAHLGDADTVWLRASVGRDGDESALELDDDALTRRVIDDLSATMGLGGRPQAVRVTRWVRSFPQYRPGHLDRVGAIEADLADVAPGVVVAGAGLRGLGVPACIRQGEAAAAAVLSRLDKS